MGKYVKELIEEVNKNRKKEALITFKETIDLLKSYAKEGKELSTLVKCTKSTVFILERLFSSQGFDTLIIPSPSDVNGYSLLVEVNEKKSKRRK